MRAAEDGFAGQQMIPGFEQGHKGGEYRTHPGGGGITCLRSFERAHLVCELLRVRIAETAVNIVVAFIGEGRTHLLCIVKAE
jgi:hypothetical protein